MPASQRIVALGMTVYARAGFHVRCFGLEQLRVEPGMIVAVSHRSDSDVPLLACALYPRWGAAAREGVPWPTFAATDDLFLRGFLAGYPSGLPLALRRLLWPVRVGGPLEAWLQCVPVREPSRMRLVELLRAAPREPLDGRLPAELRAALIRRAERLGRPEPRLAGDVLHGAYADLLWAIVDRDSTPGAGELWRAHLRAAVADFRRLGTAVRDGGWVVIFPEGEPSVDGEIGPVRSGLASLARRSHARLVQPIAISYDSLIRGRPRAYVSVAPAIIPAPGELGRAVTVALRAATPLTPGQLAAGTIVAAGSPAGAGDWESLTAALARSARELIARAREDGRPIEPALTGPRHDQVLREALAAARRLGEHDPIVARLARELDSAHRTLRYAAPESEAAVA